MRKFKLIFTGNQRISLTFTRSLNTPNTILSTEIVAQIQKPQSVKFQNFYSKCFIIFFIPLTVVTKCCIIPSCMYRIDVLKHFSAYQDNILVLKY